MEDEPPSDAGNSDDESSEDSGFALNGKEPASKRPKTAPLPSATSRRASTAPSVPATAPPAPSAPNAVGKPKTGDKTEEKAVSRASTAHSALAEWFTPLAYWQGSLKSKDVDSKVNKVVEACEALQGISSDDAKELVSKLTKLSQVVTRQTEVMDQVALFRNDTTSATEHVKAIEGHTLDTLCSFPSDCLTAMMTDIGRAIIEARWKVIRISPGLSALSFFFGICSCVIR